MSQIENQYFSWMCRMVSSRKYPRRFYHKLLHFLHGVEFTYLIAMDGNRASDGIDLRYRFGYENDVEERVIAHYLDNKPCSVLEMLVALSNRCEESIMSDADEGDRTGQWFWTMIKNLGLSHMNDDNFNETEANDIIQKFLNREYKRNGEGGLVTLNRSRYDLRGVEIWYQMMWYFDELLNGESA